MNILIIDNKDKRRESVEYNIKNAGIEGLTILPANQAYEGELNGCLSASGFDPDQCKNCNLQVNYISITTPVILFIHTSNNCFYRYVDQFLSNADDCWIVCYSGEEAASYKALSEKYPSKENFKFFICSPDISSEALKKKWDIKAFIEAVIQSQPNSNPFEFLERKGTPYLIATYVLSQGYLAAHGKIEGLPDNLQRIATTNWGKVKDNWWQPALGKDLNGAELKNELTSSEMPKEKAKETVNALINNIENDNIEMVYRTVRSILSVKS